eukprot:CAMPEP_0194167490 /NCGR_PEP_ID=MMETSP0154-20130528/2751_1 /TAXON_ID=1049557 /ORGANISM="Thalassiothrix antarctica, Strain L6-D1" /LENGTH=437 /DNA_ID=CAMNT_0038878401 /DNA_START=8 /DNA_END=1321 /DNA_ORIENTATION=+
MASISDTLNQINSTLKDSGGHYSNYSCKTVSWDDVQRGTVGGSLSCWGANITDTRLYAKDGRQLFTVRGDNWNERLGKVTTDDLALVAGHDNNNNGGAGSSDLRPITLRTLLWNIPKYGGYAGLNSIQSLADEVLDKEVSIRFQTTFLPVDNDEKSKLEFAPEAYNYNTMSDEDPRNLILLCSTQGVAVQQDGAGSKKLYHHAKVDGKINQYWLEAESSNHKVGGSQKESKEERVDALKRGKAMSSVIGTKSMGTRFNVLMTIQIPLEQIPRSRKKKSFYFGSASNKMELECEEEEEEEDCGFGSPLPASRVFRSCTAPLSIGKSSAARVSRGSLVGQYDGLNVQKPKRHPNEHITATIVMYYTCSGGVPSERDVRSAIDDLEALYHEVEGGKLGDEKFEFMKSELTVDNMLGIEDKMIQQPPPKPSAVTNANMFPN